MKWTFVIQQKLKAALLLAAIMLLIVITNMAEKENIKDMSRSFTSIYNDRLIPATDIFYLTQNLYNKRILLETFLAVENEQAVGQLSTQLQSYNTNIASLISKFEETYLVDEEFKYLEKFKANVLHYNQVENRVLQALKSQSKEKAQQLYYNEGRVELDQTIQCLEELTKIQSVVGGDLIKDSQSLVSNSNALLSLEVVFAIIIGLLIQGLLFASKVVDQRNQPFNLN